MHLHSYTAESEIDTAFYWELSAHVRAGSRRHPDDTEDDYLADIQALALHTESPVLRRYCLEFLAEHTGTLISVA